MSRGIQIHIADPELGAYLQCTPRPSARKLTRAVAAHITYRSAVDAVEPTILSPFETVLPAEEMARAKDLMDRIGCPPKNQREHIDDFTWEVNLAPRSAKNILVVGCGCGLELLFLRSVLPDARITALDHRKCLLPGVEEAVGVTFHAGDITSLLPTLHREYDLIYSNHTMEHLYDPDAILKMLTRVLIPGATIMSAMPGESMEGTPFLDQVQRFLQKKRANPEQNIHPMDLFYFCHGHPWKTNPGDLVATLRKAGISNVTVYQREDHWSRMFSLKRGSVDRETFLRARRRLVNLNRWLLLPLRSLVKLLPLRAGEKAMRYVYAFERRLPFGTNRILGFFSEELLFVGRIK